jgi:surfactin synthase thioesterase subunit
VELAAVQYPGRRERMAEQPPRRMAQLVRSLVTELAPWLEQDYVIYGDCLGAYVAYETVRRLCRRGYRPAARLVVSSAVAPQAADQQPDYSILDDAGFLAELLALGTLPPQVAEHPELAAAALPAARADFELGRSYRYRDDGPCDVPITVIVGSEDPYVPDVGVKAWAELTTAGFTTVTVPGGHDLLARADPQLRDAVHEAITAQEPR